MSKHRHEHIAWSSAFVSGVKIVDDQHRGLINLVNDMFGHASGDDAAEREYFSKVKCQAEQYIKVHFTTEEKIMIHTRFPGYPEHKKAHDSFAATVASSAESFEAGNKTALADFTEFLKEWILTHIAIMDKEYFTYFRRIATRKADGKLSITKDDVLAKK